MREGKKYTYRYWETRLYEIGELESWLSHMAAEGFHFDGTGAFLYRFRIGEPEAVRYRVDLQVAENEMLRQSYEDCGWEHAGNHCNLFQIYRSPEALQAVELHTDSGEQALLLQQLKKKQKNASIFIGVASVAMFSMILAIWFMGKTPVLNLVEGQSLQQLLMVLLYIYLVGQNIQTVRGLGRLCDHLQEGRPLNHRADWQRVTKRKGPLFIFVFCLTIPMLILCGITLAQIGSAEEYPLFASEVVESLPVVQLAEFEKDVAALSEEEKSEGYQNRWGGSWYRKEWSLLASEIYESQQRGEVPGEMWADGSGTYSPSLSTEMYRLRGSWLAQPLARELTERHDRKNWLELDGYDVREIEDSRFDFLQIAKKEQLESTEIIACRGETVMLLRYTGSAELETLLFGMAAKM